MTPEQLVNFQNGACPACKTHVDDATAIGAPDNYLPKPGDFSLCFYCGEIGVFAPDMTIRAATEKDFAELTARQLRELRRQSDEVKRAAAGRKAKRN